MDEDRILMLREITPHGGEASAFSLISREAKLEAGCRALEWSQVLGRAVVKGESTLNKFAKVMENAEVTDSKVLEHARVGGYAHVINSWIEGTADVRGTCIIYSSVVKDNAIITDRAFLEMSNIGCNARVLGDAKLYNVYFRSEANGDINNTITIEGTAQLDFAVPMELAPGTRLHEGYWTRPPLVIDTPVFPTVEGVGDRVQIGCMNRPLDYWFKKGLDKLISYGLDVPLYDQFYDAMEKMRDFKKQHGSPDNPQRTKQK
jgi:hypothetical protein